MTFLLLTGAAGLFPRPVDAPKRFVRSASFLLASFCGLSSSGFAQGEKNRSRSSRAAA
jgi:hypothetical protein